MNEKKKSIILLIIVGLIILLILIGVISNVMETKKLFDKFEKYYKSDQPTLVVLRKDNCSYCQVFEPEIKFLSEYYTFSYEEISVDKLNASDYNKMLDMLGISDRSKFGTPYTVVLQSKKVLDILPGAEEEENIFKFLKDNKFIKEEANLLIDYIGYDGYTEVLNKKEKSIIALAQTTCIHCKNVLPVLNELIRDYNINIKVLNVDKLTEEEYKKMEQSLDFFKTIEWGTPTFLIVQDGKLVQYISGEQTKEEFVKKFIEYGIIGE